MSGHTLRIPFGLAPGRDLKELVEPITMSSGGREYRLSRDKDRFVLRVSGFDSKDDAEAHIESVWRGLSWILAKRGIGFDIELEPRYVAMRDQPVTGLMGLEGEFYGVADGDGPAVFPTDRRVAFVSGGSVNAVVSGSAADFLSQMLEGIEETVTNSPLDERLRTALDLFAAHHYEATARARLLTLATALEVLAPNIDKPDEAQALLDRWSAELDERLENEPDGTDAHHGFDALKRELMFRRNASIRSRVRALAAEVLGADAPDVEELSKKALKTYDARSALVHTGDLGSEALGGAIEDGREVLRRLLLSLLRR